MPASRSFISLAARHVISVTAGGVLYRDEDGCIGWIDFSICRDHWLVNRPHALDWEQRCVGWRSTGRTPLPDVEFVSYPRVRFEFVGFAQRNALLLEPMRRFGWHTWQDTLGRLPSF